MPSYTDFESFKNHGAEAKAAKERAAESELLQRQLEEKNRKLEKCLEYTNSGIAKTYVPEWDFKEGIREFVQNAIDACTVANGGTRDGISIQAVQADGERTGSFTIMGKDENKLGAIMMDKDLNTLRLMNAGTISKMNLLLGGTEKPEGGDAIIGRFGEGMKLGIIALARIGKPVHILTAGEKWTFEFREANDFKDSQGRPTECLFYKFEENGSLPEEERVPFGQTHCVIGSITSGEWEAQQINFLDLTAEQITPIRTKTADEALAAKCRNAAHIKGIFNNSKLQGELLLGDAFKRKLYVKGLHIMDLDASYEFGYNCYDLPLDRDRRCVPDVYQQYRTFGAILASALWQRRELAEGGQLAPSQADKLNGMLEVVYGMLTRATNEVHYFYESVDADTADELFRMWRTKRELNSLCVPYHNEGQRTAAVATLDKARCTHGVYPMVAINWRFDCALRKALIFQEAQQRLDQLQQAPPACEQDRAHLRGRIEVILPKFNALLGGEQVLLANVQFKDVKALMADAPPMSWCMDGKYCLSPSLLDGADLGARLFAEMAKLCGKSMYDIVAAAKLAQ
jgi:hypothetical protein